MPRAVREQQMLDAAVQIFSVNGYHETSMDAIAAEAKISKPMLYLYYGSKEELFGACLDRELSRFISAGRLPAVIDKVEGIIENRRPDAKNAQYSRIIKEGDVLLNSLQKLSRTAL